MLMELAGTHCIYIALFNLKMLKIYLRTRKLCEYGVQFATISTSETIFRHKNTTYEHINSETSYFWSNTLWILQQSNYIANKENITSSIKQIMTILLKVTCLCFFLLMLYKASTCTIFWLCAVVFFSQFLFI